MNTILFQGNKFVVVCFSSPGKLNTVKLGPIISPILQIRKIRHKLGPVTQLARLPVSQGSPALILWVKYNEDTSLEGTEAGQDLGHPVNQAVFDYISFSSWPWEVPSEQQNKQHPRNGETLMPIYITFGPKLVCSSQLMNKRLPELVCADRLSSGYSKLSVASELQFLIYKIESHF